MNEKLNSLLNYNLDSERLKETFFTLPKKKHHRKKKNLSKKNLVTGAIVILAFLFLLFMLKSQYNFLIIPKHSKDKTYVSLFTNNLSTIQVFEKTTQQFLTKKAPLYFQTPKNIQFIVEFTKPINLKKNLLFLYLRASFTSLKVTAVAKDTNFFSNAKNPYQLLIEIPTTSYAKIPLDFSQISSQNVDFTNIRQIRIELSSFNDMSVFTQYQNWVLIKDLFLVKKEEL